MSTNEDFVFIYTFYFKNGEIKQFKIIIDGDTLLDKSPIPAEKPDWSKMGNFQCPECPLNKDEVTYCPLAIRVNSVIKFFSEFPSFAEAKISVETKERGSYKYTSVQTGISSMMGIFMAASGCPVIGQLKSLVRFHLPFASLLETEYKVLTMYILAQFFKAKESKHVDWKLAKLRKIYDDIQKVNRHVVSKLAEIEMRDSSRNAVIALNNYALYISMELEDETWLEKMREYVKDWIEM
jgi:hypothetical protein